MSRRIIPLIAVSLIGAIVLTVVIQGRTDDGIGTTAPVHAKASFTTPPPEPGVKPPPTSAQEAAMATESNDTGPLADSRDSAHETLYAVEVVKNLTPSVVQVATEALAMGSFNQPVPSRGVGTGVILDVQGHILTNNHVIDGAQRITVSLSNGDTFPAEVVGGDATTDTAVIRIDADGLQPAKLGLSSDLQVGQDVIAIGHALGLSGGPTVSKGVVSALGRSIDVDPHNTIVDLIQTDAAINPGNSGGALANAKGEVIGINTAIIQGSQGIGFAINIDGAKIVVAQLMERGYVDRGFLGITPFNLNPGQVDRLGVPVTEGIVVAHVLPGHAAEQAGLQEDDVVVQLGDKLIPNTGEMSKFLIAHPPGETVTIVFFRGEEERTTQLILGERPER